MEKRTYYKIIMILGTLIALTGALGLFFDYSFIYILILFGGVIIFNYGYSKFYSK
jgi:hypothetical protein